MNGVNRIPDRPSLSIVEQIDPENLQPGGIDTIIRDVVRFAPGHVALIGVCKDGPTGRWRTVELAGREVDFLPVARVDRARKRRIPHSVALAFGLLRYRGRLPRSLAHVHRVELGALWGGLRVGDFIQFVHNDATGLLGPSSDSFWRRLPRTYKLLERAAVRRAIVTVCFSKVAAARLAGFGLDVRAQLSWVDPSVFYPRERVERADVLDVCWVGRIDAQKDPCLAVEVLAELRSRGHTATLTMAGIGPLEPRVTALAQKLDVADHLHLLGAVSRESVAALMSRSDVMLLTSHYEGSPLVIAEAGACGTPVAATEAADPDSVIVDQENGWIATDRSPSALADSVEFARTVSRDQCIRAATHRTADAMIPSLLRIGGVNEPC